MTTAKQLQLAQTPKGRITLHVITFLKDHKFKWHWAGILREIKT